MKYHLWAMALVSVYGTILSAQTISGRVFDARSLSPLPFATVSFARAGGCFSNEDGNFELNATDSPEYIVVSYIGYKTDTIFMSSEKLRYDIGLSPIAAILPNIEVVANQQEYLSKLVWGCIKSTKRFTRNRLESKVFRRTYSRRDGRPVELMEGFYNSRTVDGHLEGLQLKNGRYGLPADDYVMNIDLGFLFQQFSLFDPYIDKLPQQPFSARTRRKLQEDYKFKLINAYPQGADTLLVIQFTPRDTANSFAGKVFFLKSANTLQQLELKTNHFHSHSFRTMEDPAASRIPKLGIHLTVRFRMDAMERLLFDLITAEFDIHVNQPRRQYTFNSQTRFVFYDYESPFTMPIFDAPPTLSDYQQIQYTPYRPSLWESNQYLVPSEDAEAFINQLEQRKLFINSAPNIRIKYVDYRYDYYRPGWNIDTNLTCKMPCVPAPLLAEEEVLDLTSADPQDSIFVKTQLYLDYDMEGDSLQYFTAAMIDYKYSYIVAPDTVKASLAEGYLQLADEAAQQLKSDLTSCCSLFSDFQVFNVQKILNEYQKELNKQINHYHAEINRPDKTKVLHRLNAEKRKDSGRN